MFHCGTELLGTETSSLAMEQLDLESISLGLQISNHSSYLAASPNAQSTCGTFATFA